MKGIYYNSILLILCILGLQGALPQINMIINKEPAISSSSELKNYLMIAGAPFTWRDATGGDRLDLTDDDYAAIPLPFDFPFYDQTFSTVYVCSNGWLSFTYPTPRSYWPSDFPLNYERYHYMVAPYWTDLEPKWDICQSYFNGRGSVYNQSFGSYVVIQWENVDYYGSQYVAGTFEVIFYESGEIIFSYADLTLHPWYPYTCGLNLGVDTNYYNSYKDFEDTTTDFSIKFIYNPEHELQANLEVQPDPIIPDTYIVTGTVDNIGMNDEFNIDLSLYIEEETIFSTSFSSLSAGASESVECVWTPVRPGTFNLRIFVNPVPNEETILNNEVTMIRAIFLHYTMIPGIPFTWRDATGGTRLDLTDDDYAAIPLPFDFPFYDQTFSTVYASSNGWLSFANPRPYDCWPSDFPLSYECYHYMVAPFWTDLEPEWENCPDFSRGGGSVYYQSFDSHVAIQWESISYYGSQYVAGTFEVIFYESGIIIFSFDDLTLHPWYPYTCGLNLGVNPDYYNFYEGFEDTTTEFSIFFGFLAPATVDFDPDTLNSKSQGNWVTVYIELPDGYDVNEIVKDSILLNDEILAESHPTDIGDHDGDGNPDLMVKFNRSAFIDLFEPGEDFMITISGDLAGGIRFLGTDEIRML